MFCNEVLLVGRLAGEVTRTPAGKGAEGTVWRLTLERQDPSGETVQETFPCVSYDEDISDLAAAWKEGDLIEVQGTLRRRHWKSDSGTTLSRIEIEAQDVEFVAAA